MKLYTKEQVKKFLKKRTFLREDYIDAMCDTLKPIELPSEEEIDNEVEEVYPISKKYKEKYKTNYDDFNCCWKEGAKWVINHIKQQDNEQINIS